MNSSRWAALFILATTAVVSAQVPTNKEPHHRTVFENSQVRILDISIPPGQMTLEHSHDLDIVTVSMSNGWLRSHAAFVSCQTLDSVSSQGSNVTSCAMAQWTWRTMLSRNSTG